MIDFEHVTKIYKRSDKPALEDIDFHVADGEFVFLVGHSGAGKSTLLKLILREELPTEGRVLVDGKDVARLRRGKVPYLRRQMGIIFQDFRLIPTMTVYENIAFAMHDTIIGESGATISGGDRQRLSIARAMLKDAPIIILDEATANVDPENEAELQEAVKALTAGKTLVMIAHRMKTVQEADQILVLDQGRIVQQGRHAELMRQGGIYADFVCSRRSAESWRIAERKSNEVKAEV